MIQRYRDLLGYIIQHPNGLNVTHRKKDGTPSRVPTYVFCQHKNGLLWLRHCEKCKFFVDYKKKGVSCKATNTQAPQYYNKERE